MKLKNKNLRHRRKIRIRKKITGMENKPRLAVYKSNKNIYVQAIDDLNQKTIATSSTLSEELKSNSLSVETAKKQAAENHHSLGKEICWLVSHGLLHLLGWDHQSSLQLKEMLNFQEQLLQHKNFGQFSDLGGSELR